MYHKYKILQDVEDLHFSLFKCETSIIVSYIISGGLSLQWLEAEFRFLARDWGRVMAERELNPSP